MITRIKIVDDIKRRTTIVETRRDRAVVYRGLVKLVRSVNRNEAALMASLHRLTDMIVLHWHCESPHESCRLIAAATLESHDLGAIIWGRSSSQRPEPLIRVVGVQRKRYRTDDPFDRPQIITPTGCTFLESVPPDRAYRFLRFYNRWAIEGKFSVWAIAERCKG